MSPLTRIDHSVILGLIPEGARVLDLGCGDGSLLEKLVKERRVRGTGIEIDDAGVRQCIEKGLPVLQGDIDEGLRDFPDGSIDHVILNQTIQAAKKPVVVLQEMLRVGVGFRDHEDVRDQRQQVAPGLADDPELVTLLVVDLTGQP